MRERLALVAERWRRFVEPTTEGMPARRVIVVPLVLIALVFVGLVAGGVTGSSTGYLNQFFSSKPDPDLIYGTPQAIRSDEWLVQTSWTISQVEQGLPLRNDAFPGGMDTTVQHDLPSHDWSVVFRPHLWGFAVLPLDNAMAVKWWLPMLALIAAGYLFVVTMLPRRPVVALALAVGFAAQPFFQWWYLSITFWPAVWALLVCTSTLWLLRSRDHRGGRIALAVITGYATVTVGMGIYAPFIVPAALVALAFSLGLVVGRRDGAEQRIRGRIAQVVPLLVAGGGALVVMGIWLATRWKTIEGFSSTVYPGERLQATGGGTLINAVALLSAPVQRGLSITSGQPLESNQSEASTFFFIGLLLLPAALWLVVGDRRARRRVDLALVAVVVVAAVMIAFIFIPHWDALAHLLLLDRTTYGRLRIGLALASLLLAVLVVARIDAVRARGGTVPRTATVSSGVLGVLVVAAPIVALASISSPLVFGTHWWILVGALMVVAGLGLLSRVPGVGAVAFALSGLLLTVGSTNPLYHGVYDLNDTALVKAMKRIDSARDQRWLGVGNTFLTNVVLTQSGLESFNGFQSTPSQKMWDEIDPGDRFERRWNRLANVSWYAGTGSPRPTNPAPDQIRMNFDSCSAFAQSEVTWVLSETRIDQSCVAPVRKLQEGPSTFYIYRITSG